MSMDLSLLPAPAVIEELNFETILARRLAQFRQLCQSVGVAYTLVLESDPAMKLLEVQAYQELEMRQRINDAAKGCMLAYATGTDLDHLAANLGVQRLVITQANPLASPPTPAAYEGDERLRERTQSALEGLTTAGPRESYRVHAMNASAQVADVGIDSPEPGTVRVSVLAASASGAPDAALLDTVYTALNAEHVRPLCDRVVVQAPEILVSPIKATLYRQPGPAGDVAAATARARLDAWLTKVSRLAAGLPRSGIDAALHQPGIQRVDLQMPAVDVLCNPTQWVRVSDITLTEVVADA